MREQLLHTLYKAIDEALANLHTACIVRVVRVNGAVLDCQPVIARVVDGQTVQLPTFLDVPPIIMQGGSSYDAMPIAAGDYGLLLITERCFDNWWNGLDGQPPADYRMHDYSDGVVIVGIRPAAAGITIPSVVTRVGNAEVTGDYEHTGDYVITGNVVVNGNLTVNGDGEGSGVTMSNTSVTLNSGSITVTGGDVTADGKHLKTHVHSGVQSGGSNTGQPV